MPFPVQWLLLCPHSKGLERTGAETSRPPTKAHLSLFPASLQFCAATRLSSLQQNVSQVRGDPSGPGSCAALCSFPSGQQGNNKKCQTLPQLRSSKHLREDSPLSFTHHPSAARVCYVTVATNTSGLFVTVAQWALIQGRHIGLHHLQLPCYHFVNQNRSNVSKFR